MSDEKGLISNFVARECIEGMSFTHIFASKNIVEITAHPATCIFSERFYITLRIMQG